MSITINGTTGIAGTNGSAGTPAVQGEDTNTGIFFPAADTVAVATAGAERMRIAASGNVGVETASPSTKLHVYGGTIRGESASSSTPGLEARGAGPDQGWLKFGSTGTDYYSIKGGADYVGMLFFTDGSERMRIDASGNLLVGTTTNLNGAGTNGSGTNISPGSAGAIVVSNSGNANIYCSKVSGFTTGVYVDFFAAGTRTGNINTNGSTTAYATSSDYRLKENIQPMTGALDAISQLNPVTYTWKVDGSAGQGFIAHELQAVVPDCVTGEKDAVDETGNPQYQGVDTSFLVATLVAAIKEQQATITDLTARIAILEAK